MQICRWQVILAFCSGDERRSNKDRDPRTGIKDLDEWAIGD